MSATLHHVHDPMCSWCWGFESTRQAIFDALDDRLQIRRLVGGLAPDSDAPMPESMQQMLQQSETAPMAVVGRTCQPGTCSETVPI